MTIITYLHISFYRPLCPELRREASREQSEEQLMSAVTRLLGAGEEAGARGRVMLRPATIARMDSALARLRRRSAARIQRWWRGRGRGRGSSAVPSEQDLIQTVLRKYETLQKQSQSLVYSFADRKLG